MGQIILLVVAAAWAAVLVPPLLRSRVENRPNSSVSDFRSQLSSLQRAMPTRGVSVRTMGRPLAPSTLSRPAASGRPPLRSGLGSNAAARSAAAAVPPPSRQASREASRMHEASLRPRRHGDPIDGDLRPQSRAVRGGRGLTPAEIKRRRANVLYMILITGTCTGFLALTTDSKPMVYLFAVAVIALGAYVYMLAMINQREAMNSPRYADSQDYGRHYDPQFDPDERFAAPMAPARTSRRPAPVDRDRYRYDEEPRRNDRPSDDRSRAVPRRADPPAPRHVASDDTPGMGVSGRISYGGGPVHRPPTGRTAGDAYGFETYDRTEPARRPPARNGRHPTGQHPAVQRPREPQPVRRGYFPQAG